VAGRRSGWLRPALSALLAALAGGLCLVVGGASAAQSPDQIQSRIDATRATIAQQRARESALSQGLARFGALIAQLQTQISGMQAVEARLNTELQRRLAAAARLAAAKRVEQARLARLRRKLARSKRVLSRRLVAIYKADDPDVVGVILGSNDFGDLIDRVVFLDRVSDQDAHIITGVRSDRDAARAAAERLALLEGRERAAGAAIAVQRNRVAAARAMLANRQAAIARVRAERAAVLASVQANRRGAEQSLGTLESRLAAAQRAFNTGLGPGGGWAIPWNIVRCESGGRNTGPNYVGASGFYQIIPSTWKLFGGRGDAAHKAPKSEQDRVASRIYNGGSGASNWVCAW
jgi:peptidoglycan hydrolase CwlO-like protein